MSNKGNTLVKDIQRRKRIRLILINTVAVAGALVIFTLLGFVGKKQKDSICWKLDVRIEADSNRRFIDESLVTRIANSATDKIVGKPLKDVDIAAVHRKLMENSSIREAHVYTTVDGRCIIRVLQRTPIARVFTADGSSYYIDKDGFTMALSDDYTARVPVFTGQIHDRMQAESVADMMKNPDFAQKSLLDDIYYFTLYICGNQFWKSMVEHVHINAEGDFEIIPRVGNQRLMIGKAENLDVKFRKLMAFYANTLHSRDLNVYSAINVEYEGQVVCVKR